MELVVRLPSVTVRATAKLPSDAEVPEMLQTGSTASQREDRKHSTAPGVPPVVVTWKVNGYPGLPVALVLLMITGPEDGAG